MVWKRTVFCLVALAVVGALTACGSGGGAGGGGTALDTALSRIADASSTRNFILFDDTAALTKIAGTTFSPSGYSSLVGTGSALIVYAPAVKSQGGIDVLGEQYAISAGLPPAEVGLIAGGQNAAQVTTKLTGQGWKRKGQRLVLEPLNLNNSLDGATGGWLSQVQPSGSDVVYGQLQTNLSLAGTPSGQTLAQDPVISALASCLGDVVAAEITSVYPLSTLKPTEVAVGVTRPASNTTVPHAVVCVAWPSSATAGSYVTALHQAFSSGTSARTHEQWSATLRDASVTNIGGGQNVVQWQAQTPRAAETVFQMMNAVDLPALQSTI